MKIALLAGSLLLVLVCILWYFPPHIIAKYQINTLQKNIQLTINYQASDISFCQTIPLGHRPCGGPNSYQIFSTETTDREKLEELVTTYNRLDKKIMEMEKTVSICTVETPPKVTLKDGLCSQDENTTTADQNGDLIFDDDLIEEETLESQDHLNVDMVTADPNDDLIFDDDLIEEETLESRDYSDNDLTDIELPLKANDLQTRLGILYGDISEIITTNADKVSQCRSIAFGSKACGGPDGYLVYSISGTDEIKLNELVREYNAIKHEWNTALQVLSTCDLVVEPTLSIKGGKCVGVDTQ